MPSTTTATAAAIYPQRGGRHRLDRELHARARLAAGEPWLQEVRVAADLPWQEADLAIKHPRSQMGGVGRDLSPTANRCRKTSWRPRCCCRWAATGPRSSPTPISHVYTEVEQLADLLDHGRLSRHAHRRCAGDGADAAPISQLDGAQTRSCSGCSAARLRRRQDRRRRSGRRPARRSRTCSSSWDCRADSYPTAELLARMGGGATHVAGPAEATAAPRPVQSHH